MSQQKPIVKQIFIALHQQQGEQGWWPAESKFEIIVGAVLTQNTAWTNVEKAIQSLKNQNLLTPEAIIACSQTDLAKHIRSSGTFNIKAKRLYAISLWYFSHGGFIEISKWSTAKLRQSLLSVHGVGPETADAIVLYVFERAVFVVDAYTKRLFGRLGLVEKDIDYQSLQVFFERYLESDAVLFGEYHAHIVEQAKNICKVQPHCKQCVLRKWCDYYVNTNVVA